ncbi:MAG: dihydrolipoyl dehydrogenase [Clostridiales bacterium]|nr:dihydrolipoyl dehydrogenase [Clostridiales bacterium]
MNKYDLTIVGSGAGLMMIDPALMSGLSVAFVEKDRFGGTCLNRGCIPSKMLVYPADLIREAQRSEVVGVHLGTPEADWQKIASRMWEKIAYGDHISESLEDVDGLDVYRGTGTFTSPNTMTITGERYKEPIEFESERLILAPGARTLVPPVEGLSDAGYVTSESFFGEKFPGNLWKRVVIVGAGAIGAEFAHIFSTFGSKVTLVEMRPLILPTEEEEIRVFVQNEFQKTGIDVLTGHQLSGAGREGDAKYVIAKSLSDGKEVRIETDEIFISAGLRPNSDILKTDIAGIETDERGWITTNEYLETNLSHIWALGDINGKYQFRHKANYEAEILMRNLFGSGEKQRANYDSVPWAVFTHPQVAHVGMTEKEALDQGIHVHVGRKKLSDVSAGSAMGYSDHDTDNGFAKIIMGEGGKLLGAHIVGPQASILVQPFVYLMNTGYVCEEQADFDRTRFGRDPDNPLRKICRQLGTVMPIMNSMVIHPSLNELTAWALANVDPHEHEE